MTIEELEKLERQLVPVLNTVRCALGKPKIILPKSEYNELTIIHTMLNQLGVPSIVDNNRLTAYGRLQWFIDNEVNKCQ